MVLFAYRATRPRTPDFLVFWSARDSAEKGPKTQVGDHTKRGPKGQKKRCQKGGFFARILGRFPGCRNGRKTVLAGPRAQLLEYAQPVNDLPMARKLLAREIVHGRARHADRPAGGRQAGNIALMRRAP